MNYIDAIKYKYILWIQSDIQWIPHGFDDLDLLPNLIKQAYGSDSILTERIEVKIERK